MWTLLYIYTNSWPYVYSIFRLAQSSAWAGNCVCWEVSVLIHVCKFTVHVVTAVFYILSEDTSNMSYYTGCFRRKLHVFGKTSYVNLNRYNRAHLYLMHIKNPTRCNSVSKFYFIFIWSSTCFGRHTAHHQGPKTALAASGFAYVGGCWTCSCWTLTASSNYTSNTVASCWIFYVNYAMMHASTNIKNLYLFEIMLDPYRL